MIGSSRRYPALAAAVLLAGSGASAQDFWKHWGDGQAELSGYRLTQPRYGAARAERPSVLFARTGVTTASAR